VDGRLLALVLGLAPSIGALAGQQPAQQPAFDVATIKRSASLDGGGTLYTPPGAQLRAVNVDARSLITFAYRDGQRLFNSQILNGPGWLESERFDATRPFPSSSPDWAARRARSPRRRRRRLPRPR